MCKDVVLAAAGVLIAAVSAAAQQAQPPDAILFPGSLNVSFGHLSPAEPGNLLVSVTSEQGVTVVKRRTTAVVVFADFTLRRDTAGHAWNRSMPATAGMKLVVSTRGGIMQAVGGVSGHLPAADASDGRDPKLAPAAYLSYWNGWNVGLPESAVPMPAAFPGDAYAVSGYLTAAEAGNWINWASVQQGVTAATRFGMAVIPYVGVAGGSDTAGHAWNNRVQWDVGAKLSRGFGGGVIEAGVARREERRPRGDVRAGATAYVNLWLGWNPRLIGK